MKLRKPDQKFFKQLGSIKLSQSKRQSTWEELSAYADLHSAQATPLTSLKWTGWSLSYVRITGAALTLLLFVSGGTAWAAQGALPDEFLYPVKLGLNESVRGAFAWSDEAEAKLATALLEERIEEAKTLAANGRLQGETQLAVASRIELYAETADQLAGNTDASLTIAVRNHIDELLAAETVGGLSVSPQLARRPSPPSQTLATTGGGSSGVSAVGARGTAEMSISSDFADAADNVSVSIKAPEADASAEQLKAELNALARVIEAHATELDDTLQVELNTKLSRAVQLLIALDTEVTDSAQIGEVAAIIDSVEASLHEVAKLNFDSETGLIIDLEFSALSNNINVTSFVECVAAGNPVMESYPEQCRAGSTTYINPEQLTQPLLPELEAQNSIPLQIEL